jgi:hypothetical protein
VQKLSTEILPLNDIVKEVALSGLVGSGLSSYEYAYRVWVSCEAHK